ncbi:hypothetical protein SLA2020_209670 [Shorea laevis]
METKQNFNNFIVGNLPTLMYIPDFITDAEEAQLLTNIYQAPVCKWTSLKNRRLQNWGGIVHEKGLLPQALPPWLKKITERIAEESGLYPSPINHVLINEYLPNQGIMPHQDGPAYFPVVSILSLGSPVVMDFTPHSKLQSGDIIRRKNDEEKTEEGSVAIVDNQHPVSILLMPRSLLIFKDDAYSGKFTSYVAYYLHSIKDSEVHQYHLAVNKNEAEKVEVTANGDSNIIHRHENRISLTCRLVSKVHKNLFRF